MNYEISNNALGHSSDKKQHLYFDKTFTCDPLHFLFRVAWYDAQKIHVNGQGYEPSCPNLSRNHPLGRLLTKLCRLPFCYMYHILITSSVITPVLWNNGNQYLDILLPIWSSIIKSTSVQIIPGCRTDARPWPEPTLILVSWSFDDKNQWHYFIRTHWPFSCFIA